MLTNKDLNKLAEARIKELKVWILAHPGKSVFELQSAKRVPLVFITDNVICMKCGHIEPKAAYALAHSGVVFTCKCGNKINVS